jgi:hypothetical protein
MSCDQVGVAGSEEALMSAAGLAAAKTVEEENAQIVAKAAEITPAASTSRTYRRRALETIMASMRTE